MKIQEYFNEPYFYIKVLIDSTKVRDFLESEVKNTDNKEEQEICRKKLKYIYRIRNNSFGMLLKYGFKCYKVEENKNTILYMNLENEIYDCQKSALKSVLGQSVDEIVNASIIDEKNIFNYQLNDIIVEKKEKFKKADINNIKNQSNKTNVKVEESKQVIEKIEKPIEEKPVTNTVQQPTNISTNQIVKDEVKEAIKNIQTTKTEIIEEIPLKEKKPEDTSSVTNQFKEIKNNEEEKIAIFEEIPQINYKKEEKETKVIKCPGCGEMVPTDHQRCVICGEKLFDKKKETSEPVVEKPIEESIPQITNIPKTDIAMAAPIKVEKEPINVIGEIKNTFTREDMEKEDNEIVFVESIENELSNLVIEEPKVEIKDNVEETSKEPEVKEEVNVKKPKVVEEVKEEIIKETIPEPIKEPVNEVKEEATKVVESKPVENNIQNDSKLKINQDALINPIAENSILSMKYSDLIMDIHTIVVKDPIIQDENEDDTEEVKQKRKKITDVKDEDEEIEREQRTIKVYVLPLTYLPSGKDLSTEIVAYIMQDDKNGIFVSAMHNPDNPVPKTIEAKTNIHDFLVRGKWMDGKFSSTVFPSGETAMQHCVVSSKVEEIRPSNITGIGHLKSIFKFEYADGGVEELGLHTIPLTDTNEIQGHAKAFYVLDINKNMTRKLYQTKGSPSIFFQYDENEIYEIISRWEGDTLKTYMLSYNQ